MKYAAVLLAAGQGRRYKGLKQDAFFRGKKLWEHVYETTLKVIEKENIIVVGKDIKGGETRTESVVYGLRALPTNVDRVIILEAARPLVTKEQIVQLLELDYPSVTFVRPLVNTVIYRNGEFINREDLYNLLTPQAFNFKMLLKAFESKRFFDMTDETRVMFEFYGIKPYFIETEAHLFKVTYPEDLGILESIYQLERKEGYNS